MKLVDLRRITIKTSSRIRFPLSNGMECLLNEHGIAEVPGMRAAGDINLEEELARAPQFTLESAAPAEKTKPRPQILTRDQMAAMVSAKTAEAAHDDHEE
jgi:hypothetical protein